MGPLYRSRYLVLLITAVSVLWTTMAVEEGPPGGDSWQKPGCHLLGHTRVMHIPDCLQFSVMTNACRGFCPSVSLPATSPSPRPITSLSQCCSIMESQPLTVSIMCVTGKRNVTLLSPTSCSCYHCHKD